MKKLFKRIMVIMLAFCFSVCFSGVLNAAIVSQNNRFTVFLSGADNLDLSEIVIKIYKKINITPLSQNLSTYEMEYFGSAQANYNGKIVFEKPDGPFVIEFDLQSLPQEMGVNKRRLSYNNVKVQSDTVNLKRVVSAEAYFAGENLNFLFKDINDENLIVNYELESHNTTNSAPSKLSTKALAEKYSGEIDCILTHSGNVNVNGALIPYRVDESYFDLDYLQYISLLYSSNCITRDEQTLMLCKFLESEYGTKYRDLEMSDILQSLKLENQDLKVQNSIDETIALISERTYVRDLSALSYKEKVFYCGHGLDCCEGGEHNIKVYYPSSLINGANIANTVANKAVNVFDYFINQLGFACPKSIDYTDEISNINNSFCILLSSDIDAVGAVDWGYYGNNLKAAYIILDYTETNRFDTAIAHELQHCIQNQYKLTSSSDLWWKESCANWAAMLYAENVLEDLSLRWDEYKGGIEDYLDTTTLSLTNSQGIREYSVLFPMLLAQMNNGEATIRAIYEEIELIRSNITSMTDQEIFTAINNVIEETSDYNLRHQLEFFGKANYSPKSYYNFIRNNFQTDLKAARQNLSLSSVLVQNIDPVGYGYYIFEPSSNSSSQTMSIFIETDNHFEGFTVWTREGFREDHYINEVKHTLTSNMLGWDYTITSSMGEYLVLIVENTATTAYPNDGIENFSIEIS